jgi:hypothetical protein
MSSAVVDRLCWSGNKSGLAHPDLLSDISFSGIQGRVTEPALVCNNWLCTSLDVEAGLCNPLSKKIQGRVVFQSLVSSQQVLWFSQQQAQCMGTRESKSWMKYLIN